MSIVQGKAAAILWKVNVGNTARAAHKHVAGGLDVRCAGKVSINVRSGRE